MSWQLLVVFLLGYLAAQFEISQYLVTLALEFSAMKYKVCPQCFEYSVSFTEL